MAQKLFALFQQLNDLSGGRLSVLQRSIARFTAMHGTEASASLAYYALFSIFPLALLLVSITGMVMGSEIASRQTTYLITLIFPFSEALVRQNLAEAAKTSGATGIISLLVLLWSSSGYFHTLVVSINRAWSKARLRGVVLNRLLAIAMVFALILLMFFSLISSTVVNLLPSLSLIFGGVGVPILSSGAHIALRLIPAFFTLLMFSALYRWVPNKVVSWKAVLAGALVTTAIWEGVKYVFSLYLNSGLSRYGVVYGSLEALIVLMVWIYFSNLISLYGAYLVAAIEQDQEQKVLEGNRPASATPNEARL